MKEGFFCIDSEWAARTIFRGPEIYSRRGSSIREKIMARGIFSHKPAATYEQFVLHFLPHPLWPQQRADKTLGNSFSETRRRFLPSDIVKENFYLLSHLNHSGSRRTLVSADASHLSRAGSFEKSGGPSQRCR
jgi:hypothetical protein